jgi:hypothetical protein
MEREGEHASGTAFFKGEGFVEENKTSFLRGGGMGWWAGSHQDITTQRETVGRFENQRRRIKRALRTSLMRA